MNECLDSSGVRFGVVLLLLEYEESRFDLGDVRRRIRGISAIESDGWLGDTIV